MIIKTKDFNDNFLFDLREILSNNNTSIIKGSYKIKENGDYITDIDIEENVKYSQRLIDNLIHKIVNSSSFIFIHLNMGIKKEFILPWNIDNEGGCKYDPKVVAYWYKNFKQMNLVPKTVYEYIENKLFLDTISIKSLIDVEDKLQKYSGLYWKLEDIKKGYITFLDTTYKLLDIMKIDQPVLEFIYKYNNDYCLVDIAIVDKNYKYGFEHNMYKYYTQDWYKIMKLFRWKIKKQYQREYLTIMKTIDIFIAILSKFTLIEYVSEYKLLPIKEFKNIEIDIKTHLKKIDIKFTKSTKEILKNKVNEYLEKYIDYFKHKLNDNFINEFNIQYNRGLEAQILLSRKIINKRVKNNIKCPFFSIDIKEYKKLYKICRKLKLDINTIVKCFEKISNEMNVKIHELLEITDDILVEYDIINL